MKCVFIWDQSNYHYRSEALWDSVDVCVREREYFYACFTNGVSIFLCFFFLVLATLTYAGPKKLTPNLDQEKQTEG